MKKGKFSTKILYEEIQVFLETSANNIALGNFFSLKEKSFYSKNQSKLFIFCGVTESNFTWKLG